MVEEVFVARPYDSPFEPAYRPIAKTCLSVRTNIWPFEIAGDATARSPSALRATICGCAAGLDHDRVAVLADEVDVPAAGDRRRREHALDALLPDALARGRVDGRQHADVVRHVDDAVVVEQRRDIRRARRDAPDRLAGVHVAASARLDAPCRDRCDSRGWRRSRRRGTPATARQSGWSRPRARAARRSSRRRRRCARSS